MLNSGETRLTVATTDIETGELVLFDTARGDRITVDHVLASCGYLPEFAPVEIGGRLLGDGGLSANAPIEALLHDRPERDIICVVLDLFPRDGVRPADLETSLARKSDLTFANQTWMRLEGFCREEQLRAEIREGSGDPQFGTSVYYLSYRPDPSEAGSERMFDYSGRSTSTRWREGEADMRAALALAAPSKGANLVAIRRSRPDVSSDAGDSKRVRAAAGSR
jgi:NTE family protein